MERVIVIGCPGAGKSTFARGLRNRTGLPLYYLDRLWHRPDRTTVSPAQFDAQMNEILAQPRWILDGNYQRTLPRRLAACDTVFFLDLPAAPCLAGVASRIGRQREDMPWIETEFDPEFRQYIMDFHKIQRPILYKTLKNYEKSTKIIRFSSRAEADAYLRTRPGKTEHSFLPVDVL